MLGNEPVPLHWKDQEIARRWKIENVSADLWVTRVVLKPHLTPTDQRGFTTYYKEPFTKPKLARLVNEFKVKGTYKKKWTPMDLRHSFAVNYLLRGGDMRELQYLLGHWNVYETKKLYGEVGIRKAASIAESPLKLGLATTISQRKNRGRP